MTQLGLLHNRLLQTLQLALAPLAPANPSPAPGLPGGKQKLPPNGSLTLLELLTAPSNCS